VADAAPQTNDSDRLPLAGIRVIEAGVLLAGPFCGQLLGDFGAEVIKIEQPHSGDPMREWGHAIKDGEALWWPIVARNKKSVELDLRVPAGQEAFLRLSEQADIVLENFRPGTMEQWGLGYEELTARNPGLILVRVSGYGQTGPYSHRVGYASVGEAMGGLRYVVGYPDRPPSRVGISLGDSLAGTFATLGALVALHERGRTGQGQVVDTAIYEAVFACMESIIPEYVLAGNRRERTGSSLPNVAPSNVYPALDGELIIAANQDTLFGRLAVAMDRADLTVDPRFASHIARGKNQNELDHIIAEWSAAFTVDELSNLMEKEGIAFGRVYRADDMVADEHFRARVAIISRVDKRGRDFPMQNVFPRLSRTPGRVRSLGPDLGEHNAEILDRMLKLSAEQIAAAQGGGQ
jgi:formyl-CoA transferase